MIEVEEFSGRYPGVEVVHDISLSSPDGQIAAVVGPNGCSKSTLPNLCCGQLHQTQGEVLADGKSLPTLPRMNVARAIALPPQSRTIPDITVGALVLHDRFPWLGYPRVYREEDRTVTENAMTRTGIQEKSHKLLARLSGGERQKAYFVMLLAQDTSHILLDEPTTYPDINHQLQLFFLLIKLKQGGKCVVATLHDLGTALELVDRVAVMRKGRLLIAGAPEQMILSDAIEDVFGIKIGRREQYASLRQSTGSNAPFSAPDLWPSLSMPSRAG